MASMAFGTLPMAAPALQSHTLSSSRLVFPRSNFFGTTLSTSSLLPLSISQHSSQTSSPLVIYCGRGDKKTARGKRFRHSYGNARPRNKKKGRGPPRTPAPPRPRKEDPEDKEIIEIDTDESLFDPSKRQESETCVSKSGTRMEEFFAAYYQAKRIIAHCHAHGVSM